MKLIRFGEPGAEKPGVIINEKRYDVSEYISEYNEQFFGGNGIERLAKWVSDNHNNLKPVDDNIRLGAPLARPSKVICIGLNYVDHAKETGATAPQEPILFFKSSSAVVGPNDDLVIPKGSEKTDWEVELAVIIGKKASYVAEENANAYIAGYCLHNDYSERTFQLERGGQWVKGKSCDTFAPLGPFITAYREWENDAGWKYQQPYLQNPFSCSLHQPVYDPVAGRCYFNGYTARRGHGYEAAARLP